MQLSDGSWAIGAVNNRAARDALTGDGLSAHNVWFDQGFNNWLRAVLDIINSRGAQRAQLEREARADGVVPAEVAPR